MQNAQQALANSAGGRATRGGECAACLCSHMHACLLVSLLACCSRACWSARLAPPLFRSESQADRLWSLACPWRTLDVELQQSGQAALLLCPGASCCPALEGESLLPRGPETGADLVVPPRGIDAGIAGAGLQPGNEQTQWSALVLPAWLRAGEDTPVQPAGHAVAWSAAVCRQVVVVLSSFSKPRPGTSHVIRWASRWPRYCGVLRRAASSGAGGAGAAAGSGRGGAGSGWAGAAEAAPRDRRGCGARAERGMSSSESPAASG